MIKWYFLTIILQLGLLLTVNAQLFDNQSGKCFSPLPKFSSTFIQASKIKSIKGYYSYKKAGETMVKSDNYQLIEFDSLGNASRFFQINKSGSLIDTTWIDYENSIHGLITLEKNKSGSQFHTKEFKYDTLGNATEISFYLETPQKIPINKEFVEYEINQFVTKSTYFNQYNLPYQIVTETKNENGYLIERKTIFIMTNSSTKELFAYSKKGLLESIKTIYSEDDSRTEEVRFNYDDLGRLTEKQSFRNGVHVTEIQILYNSKTGLYSSIITRNVNSNYMTILRFQSCTYY